MSRNYDEIRPIFVGSDVFRRSAFGGNHPLNIIRHAAVLDLSRMLGWLPETDFRASKAASIEQLSRFHDRDYLEALQNADATGKVAVDIRHRYHIGTLENPLFPGLFERAATTVGGSILAAQLAAAGAVVFHPSGGTHHGKPDRASGFCYLNDPVFAILTLLDEGLSRVCYIDLDAHHGDGVEQAFSAEPRVMTVSVHEQNRWPFSGTGHDAKSARAINLPVPKGFNDSELDYLMEQIVLPAAADFGTDAFVICCGADSLAGDPLSGMMLSNVALWQTVGRIAALGSPSVVLGGGGYNPWTVTRYWVGMWGYLNRYDIPQRLPFEATKMLRDMECDLIDEEDVDPQWLTTLADSPNRGDIREPVLSLQRWETCDDLV